MSEPIGALEQRAGLTSLARSIGADPRREAYFRELLGRNLAFNIDLALDLALEIGPPLPELVRSAIEDAASPELLDRLAEHFEGDQRRRLAPMRGIADWVARRRLKLLLDHEEELDLEEQAEVARIGIRIGGFAILDGRPAEARDLLEESLAVLESLEPYAPGEFRLERAIAANDLGEALRDLELRPEALLRSEQALAILRDLARDDPGHRSNVASSLLNLGVHRAELGDERRALRDVRLAVAILRHLEREDPQLYRADLALGRIALANRWRSVGNFKAAKRCLDLGVELLDRRSETAEPAYASQIALARQNSAVVEAALGNLEEAMDQAKMAAGIFRNLARNGSDRDRLAYAESLRDWSAYQIDDGRWPEAERTLEEGLALTRPLVRSGVPGVFECRADLLVHREHVRFQRGDIPGAIRSARQAIRIFRRLASASPETYANELATGLNSLGSTLQAVDRSEESLAFLNEAVAIWQRLAAREPGAYDDSLAGALSNLASCHLNLGNLPRAYERSREAIDRFRALAKVHPAVAGIRFSQALRVLRDIYEALKDREGAWRASRESIMALSQVPGVERRATALVVATLEEHEIYARAAGRDPEPALLEPLRQRVEALPLAVAGAG